MSDADALPLRLPAPPASPQERTAWLRLLRSYRVGPSTFHRLLGEHGSAEAALAALPEIARNAGVSGYRACPEDQARAELAAGKRAGARLVALGEGDYPAALRSLDDPPPLLWLLGDPALAARPAVALVGTRQATSLGLRMARALAEDLGQEGYVIASGLARGIDTAAHMGGLQTGTIAVMAGGVDVVYPLENADLAAEIARTGLRISDQPMGLAPQARHFVRRNRLIAGLSEAVVVVEAASRSGALITARDALEAGREVLAVPGHPMDSRVSGCNQLIRDGAVLVRSAADVIEALGARGGSARPLITKTASPAQSADEIASRRAGAAPPASQRLGVAERIAAKLRQPAGDLPQRILRSLSLSPQSEDQLGRDLGVSSAMLDQELLDLELNGEVERRAGGLLSRRH